MSIAIETQQKTAGEVYTLAANFTGKLDDGELLTGTPTVVENTTTDLTIASVAVNTAELTISGETVAIGKAVQCSVSGGTAGSSYTMTATVTTDSTPAGTRKLTMRLNVVADEK